MNDSVIAGTSIFRRPFSAREAADNVEAWITRNSSWVALGIIAAAFAVRLAYSASCYLNPDEAQHFNAARKNSWLATYEASRLLAHPPLFILVLHAFLFLGRSELVLRLPSVIGGTSALWLTFAWIRRCLGAIPALAGLLFMAVSPAAISASTEARQYGLLLVFVCASLYATERALTERSILWAILQGAFLIGAILTHYTAPVVVISLDLYVLVRCLFDGVPRRVWIAICAGQAVLVAVFGCLCIAQFRHAGLSHLTSLPYLQQSFYGEANETLFGFARRAFIEPSRTWSAQSGLFSPRLFSCSELPRC